MKSEEGRGKRKEERGKRGGRNAELTQRLPQWGKLSSERETDEVFCRKGICLCNTSPVTRMARATLSLWRGLRRRGNPPAGEG